jgi:CRP-like cAMP-binding protein
MSPEVMAGRETYNKKADIWSLGCSFYEMMILQLDRVMYVDLFLNENFYKTIEERITKKYPKKFSNLIIHLLQKDPEKRPSSEELLKKLENFDSLNDFQDEVILKNENCFNFELLDKVSFLKNASKELTMNLVESLKPRLFKKGEMIIKFGDEGESMFFINKGVCNVTSGDGKQLFNVLSEGSFFGEYAILYPLKRTANVIANSSCDLFELSKSDFHKILMKFPEFEAGIRKFGLGLILNKIPSFKSFSEEFLEELTNVFTPKSFLTTDLVLEKGEVADRIYFVYNGCAAVMNEGSLLKVYQIGDYFGVETLKESKYLNNVIALTCLDLIEMTGQDYQKILQRNEEFSKLFI